jgi:hypothetical protein
MLLTACEWLDVFVDQQLQIRRGVKKNGRWHLIVDRPGQYEFELRRWPRESGLGLAEGAPATTVTDGRYPAGEAFPIEAARLKIGDTDVTRAADDDGQAVTVRVELRAGPTELQTWLLDAAGEEICGAYYVDVHRRP